MSDPLAPIRSGAAGVVLPPGPSAEHVEVRQTIRGTGRLAGELPVGADPGTLRLLQSVADRLRRGG